MNLLLGEWSLVSCKGQSKTGQEFLPYGERPIGYLNYSANNRVIVILSHTSRANFESEDLSKVTISEKAKTFDEFDSYYGNYTIDTDKKIVIHQILTGKVPNWIGQNHMRHYDIDGDKLTLKTEPFFMNGEYWEVLVNWVKI